MARARALIQAIAAASVVTLTCVACQGAVSLDQRSPAVATIVQPWGKTELQRSGTFVLPREAQLTVAVVAESHAPQELQVLGYLRGQLPLYFGPQALADEPLMLEEAMQLARQQEADFLLTFRLLRWPGGFVDSASSQCPERRAEACELSTIDPDMKLTLQVYDVVNGRVVDSVTAHASLGIQSWVVEDVSPLVNNTLARMLDSLAP